MRKWSKSALAKDIHAFLCPILLLNYNISPWLTIKTFFIMLSLLIPGPDAITTHCFDVFLKPLLEEIKELWSEGVMCNDVARSGGEATFTLRAIFLWCVHDFPAYAMMAGTSNQGYCACPVCGPNTPIQQRWCTGVAMVGGSRVTYI